MCRKEPPLHPYADESSLQVFRVTATVGVT